MLDLLSTFAPIDPAAITLALGFAGGSLVSLWFGAAKRASLRKDADHFATECLYLVDDNRELQRQFETAEVMIEAVRAESEQLGLILSDQDHKIAELSEALNLSVPLSAYEEAVAENAIVHTIANNSIEAEAVNSRLVLALDRISRSASIDRAREVAEYALQAEEAAA